MAAVRITVVRITAAAAAAVAAGGGSPGSRTSDYIVQVFIVLLQMMCVDGRGTGRGGEGRLRPPCANNVCETESVKQSMENNVTSDASIHPVLAST